MKAVVLEIKNGVAAVLTADGEVVKTRQKCSVGETIELDRKTARFPDLRQKLTRTAAAAAAAVIVSGGSYTYTTALACSYVSLDVDGSSVELSINRMDRVIGVRAMNDGSEDVARELISEIKNKKLEDAIDNAMSFFDGKGCFDGERDMVVAGVTADTGRRSERISEALGRFDGKEGRPEMYEFDVSPSERREAHKNDLSGGRYAYRERARSV